VKQILCIKLVKYWDARSAKRQKSLLHGSNHRVHQQEDSCIYGYGMVRFTCIGISSLVGRRLCSIHTDLPYKMCYYVCSYCVIILRRTVQKHTISTNSVSAKRRWGTTQSLRRSATSARRQMHQTAANPVGRNLCMTR